MADLQLPPSVRDLRAIAIEAIADRMAQIDLSPLLVYRLATTPAGVIPFLAWQFDVQSPMYQLLVPGADQRQMVQNAVALKRFMGTPYALKTALKNLGWANAEILEGQDSWGGNSWPADEGWAVCRIVVPLVIPEPEDFIPWQSPPNYPAGALVTFNGNFFKATAPASPGTVPQFASIDDVDVPDDLLSDVDLLVQSPWRMVNPANYTDFVTLAQAAQIAAVFYFFAPKRCWLDSIIFVAPQQTDALAISDSTSGGEIDQLAFTDALNVTWPAIVDAILNSVIYDRSFDYSGVTYAGDLVGITDGPITVNGVPWEGNQ
jgi:phage tail P2-like protein